MTDAPDPLGKRALFWAPAERDEHGPRRPSELAVVGKHALFSDEARSTAARARPGLAAAPARPTRPARHARRGVFEVAVHCSSCGVRRDVHMAEFALLHLPVWLWWPGRGHTRFMTCPSCRRRTWVSASWTPWVR